MGILILSEAGDQVAANVTEWLIAANSPFKRINFSEEQVSISLSLTSEKVKLSLNDNSDLSKIWLHRGRLQIGAARQSNTHINNYLAKEQDSVLKSLENILKSEGRYIGSYLKEVENYKMEMLYLAAKAGLEIPDTLVTTSKAELLSFYTARKKIITKDLRYPVNIKTQNGIFTSVGTLLVEKEMIDFMEEAFAPLFVQEYTEKQYEARVFVFMDKLYAMAIFSQGSNTTAIDYRNYNDENPNRMVPVHLPPDIEEKVRRFMKEAGLDSGSIDLIVTPEGKYIFLEVNPQGQFGWLSENCNYYIEKEIAEELLK